MIYFSYFLKRLELSQKHFNKKYEKCEKLPTLNSALTHTNDF